MPAPRYCSRLVFVVALAAQASVGFATLAGGAWADALRLGPRDRLRIKAYDWRPSTGELHEWPGLTGEFTVAASGLLSLPVAGDVLATGATPEGLAQTIATQLQDKIGLTRKPEVAVEVSEYRPFYVLGRVNKPGEYPARSGLTVLEALSVAGGAYRPAELSSYELDRRTEIANGDVRAQTAERIALLGRQARLEAELHDATSIAIPDELSVKANSRQSERVISEEKQLLDTRTKALRSQIDGLTQAEALLTHEIEAQGEKRKTLERQVALAKRELDSVSGLVAKGLVVTSRQLALEQNVAQFESSRSDLDLLVLRAQQDLARIGREKTDLRDRRRTEILTELTLISGQIATNAEKIRTARALANGYEQKGSQEIAATAADPLPSLQFSITRDEKGQNSTKLVADDAIVEPGDTLRVEIRPAALARD